MANGILIGLATFLALAVAACDGDPTPTSVPTPFVTSVVTATPTPTHGSEPIIAEGQGTQLISTPPIPRGYYIATVEVKTSSEANFRLVVDDLRNLKDEIELANSNGGELTQYDEANSVWEATALFDTCALEEERLAVKSVGLASEDQWSVTLTWQQVCL